MYNCFKFDKMDAGDRRIVIRALRNLGYKKKKSLNHDWFGYSTKVSVVYLSKKIDDKYTFSFHYMNTQGVHRSNHDRHMFLNILTKDKEWSYMWSIYSKDLSEQVRPYGLELIPIDASKEERWSRLTTMQSYLLSIVINKELTKVLKEISDERERQQQYRYKDSQVRLVGQGCNPS